MRYLESVLTENSGRELLRRHPGDLTLVETEAVNVVVNVVVTEAVTEVLIEVLIEVPAGTAALHDEAIDRGLLAVESSPPAKMIGMIVDVTEIGITMTADDQEVQQIVTEIGTERIAEMTGSHAKTTTTATNVMNVMNTPTATTTKV